jgi:hypothetical protein
MFVAKLIEECGLKGLKVGGAVVSKKHYIVEALLNIPVLSACLVIENSEVA